MYVLGPLRITLVAVAAKEPMIEPLVPAVERIFSTSLAATWITPYGPEGEPGRMPLGTAVGTKPPGLAVATGGAAGTVGRTGAGVAVGRSGVGESAGGGVAGCAVGVERRTGVGRGVGALSRESEQALRLNTAIQTAKRIRVRFMSLSFLVGLLPPD